MLGADNTQVGCANALRRSSAISPYLLVCLRIVFKSTFTLESAFCHPLDVAPDADVDSDIGLDADTDLGFDDDDLDPVTAYSPENDGSCDEETSDEDSGEEEWVQGLLHGFRVGDKVRVWWSMQEPQGWFTGIIEKVGAEVLRVKYPDGWRDHDPNKWSIEKL